MSKWISIGLVLAFAACNDGSSVPGAMTGSAAVSAANGGGGGGGGGGGAARIEPARAESTAAAGRTGNTSTVTPSATSSAAGQTGAGMSGARAAMTVGDAGHAGDGPASVAAMSGGSGGANPGNGGATGNAAIAGMPSAGCAKMATRPNGGKVMQSDRIYAFPTSYDGKTPMPLLLGLHAAGNPNTQLQNLTDGTRLETNFVRVFPKSAGSAWVYDTDISKVKSVLDDVLSNYCIDTTRMFATGHSSGAQMVVQLLCHGEQRFKAVAPVAASKYCAKISPVPVLYIQGMMDAQRGGGNGSDLVNVFTTSNGCASSTKPKTDVPGCMSTFDHMPVTPGCVVYDGCMVPTAWCSHNDNGYNSTDGHEHGWPCFASNAIADFFMSLP